MSKIYKYEGEEFEVSEPKDCRITVTGRGVAGHITINDNMGMYQDIVMQWRYHHTNINDALQSCCKSILKVAGKASVDELCKKMEAFYESLD